MSIAVSAIPSPYIHASQKRRKNIWYSVKDGNWSDPNTWMSNALSFAQFNFNYPGQAVPSPIFPALGDDVYINHTITLNLIITVNNIYVSGNLNLGGNVLTVNGDMQATGTVSGSGTAILRGINNYIVNYTGTGQINYDRYNGDQMVMNVPYNNIKLGVLAINRTVTRYFISDITAQSLNSAFVSGGALVVVFECGAYNFTCNGLVNFGTAGNIFSKSGSGTITFIGLFTLGSFVATGFTFDGNPDVEFRAGFTGTSASNFAKRTGTGTWRFTTASQTLGGGLFPSIDSPMIIVGAITLTNTSTMTLNSSFDGTVAGSTLINKGTILFGTLSSVPIMVTAGVFDATTFANTLGYIFNGDYVLPYTFYQSLWISGTGTKTFSSQPTIVIDLTVTGVGSNLDFGTYNIDIPGTANVIQGTLIKSGVGSVLFEGQLMMQNGATLSFTGNPTVELRGGILFNTNTATLNTGTQPVTFTTDNQSITASITGGIFNGSGGILISGAITLTRAVGATQVIIIGPLNGDNAASTFDNRGALFYQNTARPMITGVLQCNAGANIFKYNMLGNQDVAGGTYRTIEFGGSGVKTLQGNVVVNVTGGGGQSTTGTASVNLNGFSITSI